MRKTIELSDDVEQDKPVAWLVFDDRGDSYIYWDRREAEDFAMEQKQYCDDGSPLMIYPLWAGRGQAIEEDAT